MKKGTYIASTDKGGAVMFRVDGVPHTLRKGNDITLEIGERTKVQFPAQAMTLKLKSESKPTVAKKEIKVEAKKVEPKVEAKVEAKVEPKAEVKEEPKVVAKKAPARGRKKSVKIETEEK